MVRIFITGSSDGIGLVAARTLISRGHSVVLHARNAERAAQTKSAAPGAESVLVSDISEISGMKQLAAEANKSGRFDVVIHNAGVGFSLGNSKTQDGLPTIFAVNSLAPYVLTALIDPPKRLIYTSSSLHSGGDGSLKDITYKTRSIDGFKAYSDSKLHNVILANAVARKWKQVESNSVDPGWISTKMGGASAPGSVESGAETLSFLADGDSHGTGKLFKNCRPTSFHNAASDVGVQDELLKVYGQLSGVPFPSG